MTNLITVDNLSLAFGRDVLLEQVKFQISEGDRICLIGRNGAGKTSLLKILEGVMAPDSGNVWHKPGLKIARLAQELPQDMTLTLFEYVAQGLSDIGELLTQYHTLTHQLDEHSTLDTLTALSELQQQIDAKEGWQFEQALTEILQRFKLDPEQHLSSLSGGWRRRAALARALVVKPDLLLLDEPTNHLDIEAIESLEQVLLDCGASLIFITHDRALLQRLANRILELDRGNVTLWPESYTNFLRRKEEMLHAESKQNALFDKRLAEEEKWIRQGVKARRTRNEGRVRALKAMREESAQRRVQQGKASFQLNEAEKSGNLVVKVEKLNYEIAGRPLIKNFSFQLMRRDRIGLVGPNGIGKSTLLNLLLGNLVPQEGVVTLGTKLQVAYFDQLRKTLNGEKTAIENLEIGSDTLEVNGKKRHVMSYLGDFLFTPQRAMTPVKVLSGGECHRLLLAKLFSQPSNLLVMDEPTNDLDIETLELLEELLSEYQGTLLLVSHDRVFLDNVVTRSLVFQGNGKIQEYVGGFSDWQHHLAEKIVKASNDLPVEKKVAPSDKMMPLSKLSPQEKKELAGLPKKIEKLETEKQRLELQMSDSGFYQKEQKEVQKNITQLQKIIADIKEAYSRWESLDSLSQN